MQKIIRPIRCAVYTRKSTDEGLDSDFNSLDAQREAGEAYVASQRNEGWLLLPDRYDDGGFSGGSLERPALQRLLKDIEAGRIDCVVVYKVDRLSRSLLDFSRLVEILDRHKVSFVSVTQHFNTTDSMGRLTLNILLSFAQFEREIITERVRDKIAAAKKRGKHCGGLPPLGYDLVDGKLVVNPQEAKLVRYIFNGFVKVGSTTLMVSDLNCQGYTTKTWTTREGKERKGHPWNKFRIYDLLNNRTYLGEVTHKGNIYRGEQSAIIPRDLWDKVHAILAKSQYTRGNHTRARTPALLKGLIRCGHCQTSMGITFTRKAARMYRYYLCANASKGGYEACSVKSVSAGEIEGVVIGRLRAALRDPEIVARISHVAESPLKAAEVRDALQNVDSLWNELFPAEQARIVELLVEGVVVEEEGITLTLRPNGLRSLALESQGAEQTDAPATDTGDPISVSIPMRFKRRGGRKEIIVPESDAPDVESVAPPQEPLVLALAQAHRWQELLDSGKVETAGELAKRLKVSKAYITRTLRLNYLAPDIVRAILDGREPSGLSLTVLTGTLPMLWEEQRKLLGFAPTVGVN
ncbi:MAG: recombinase family protein [Thermoguttaceae bacterium]